MVVRPMRGCRLLDAQGGADGALLTQRRSVRKIDSFCREFLAKPG